LTTWLGHAILLAMASRLRLQYEGAIYHVINRGDHQELREFRWSSFPEYLRSPAARPGWLRVDRLLGEHGIHKDSPAGRAELEKRMELRRAAEDTEALQDGPHGWCLGSEDFRRELLAQMEHQLRTEHFGPEIRDPPRKPSVCSRRTLGESAGRRRNWPSGAKATRRSLKWLCT
jgi:hypothetical protein